MEQILRSYASRLRSHPQHTFVSGGPGTHIRWVHVLHASRLKRQCHGARVCIPAYVGALQLRLKRQTPARAGVRGVQSLDGYAQPLQI